MGAAHVPILCRRARDFVAARWQHAVKCAVGRPALLTQILPRVASFFCNWPMFKPMRQKTLA